MGGFATTQWSLIVQARGEGASGRDALNQLCRNYRDPVAAYIRHSGANFGDIEDLVQAFFLHFLERNLHARADPLRGGFRPYLLTALRNFLRSEAVSMAAAKRGRAQTLSGEDRLDSIATEDDGPERAFDRAWALAVLRRAMQGLQEECVIAGKQALFGALQPCLVEPPDAGDYARLGAALGMTPNTIAVAVKRLRLRLRERIRDELGQTVADAQSLAFELELLRGVL